MAKFNRIEVYLKMKETGLVPLFYNPDVEICKKVIQACYEGGIRVFEFTNRGEFAHETFIELMKYCRSETPEIMLGAGTIIDGPTASSYIQAGADFIVSPIFKKEIALICNRRKILWSPGCFSLSEISDAEDLGAEIVKLFPAQIVGPEFIKAVKGPSPWSNIMPSGGIGITRNELSPWFQAGADCIGVGSQLIGKDILINNDFPKLEKRIRNTLEIIKNIRDE